MLISAAIAISYFDRQTLPVAIRAIQLDIPISNTQFSQLQAAFLTAYALMYAGGGKLVDVLGTRTGFLAIMVWWSLACASHGLATSTTASISARNVTMLDLKPSASVTSTRSASPTYSTTADAQSPTMA